MKTRDLKTKEIDLIIDFFLKENRKLVLINIHTTASGHEFKVRNPFNHNKSNIYKHFLFSIKSKELPYDFDERNINGFIFTKFKTRKIFVLEICLVNDKNHNIGIDDYNYIELEVKKYLKSMSLLDLQFIKNKSLNENNPLQK
jgi:hypothetical protein